MDYLRTHPELLAAFRRGDRAAMGKVWDSYVRQVKVVLTYGFYVKSTGGRVPGLDDDDDQIAEVLQAVFLRACRREARLAYDGERDYGPYIATIARNELVTHYRKRGREIAASDRESYEDALVTDGERTAEAAHDDPKALAILEESLAALPSRLRALHTARYEDELSFEDTAARLGISPTMARKLEARLLRDLSRSMKRAGLLSRITPTPGTPSHG